MRNFFCENGHFAEGGKSLDKAFRIWYNHIASLFAPKNFRKEKHLFAITADPFANKGKQKMKNIWLRIISLMLVSLMLVFAVACTTPETPQGGNETTAAPGGTTGENGETQAPGGDGTTGSGGGNVTTKPAESTAKIDVPEGLNYQNEVTVLFWEDVEMPEFEQAEPSINGVLNAIYKRNENTKKHLGLTKLSWVGVKGNHGQKEEFTEHVGNSYIAGDRKYDIIATYSRTAGHCAIEGYLYDLESIEDSYIDLSKPWWPQSLIDTVTIDDAIYFLSGDISTNTLHMMYAIFCNTDMITELTLDDPVDMAINMEWTLPEFMRLCEGVFTEQNGDDKPSVGDRYGFITEQLHIDAFYQGGGFNLIEADVDDVLVISKDFSSSKLNQMITDLKEFRFSPDVMIGSSEAQFVDENALFTQNRMYLAERKLKDVEFKYACLPTPMLDTKQGEYRTCVGNPFTLWGIMRDVDLDGDEMLVECSAALECLAGYANYYTTPQIFEVNMKVKYSDIDKPETVQCFDLIREGVVYDLGRIFPNTEMGGLYMVDLFSKTISGGLEWSTERKANMTLLLSSLKQIVKKFEKHANH